MNDIEAKEEQIRLLELEIREAKKKEIVNKCSNILNIGMFKDLVFSVYTENEDETERYVLEHGFKNNEKSDPWLTRFHKIWPHYNIYDAPIIQITDAVDLQVDDVSIRLCVYEEDIYSLIEFIKKENININFKKIKDKIKDYEKIIEEETHLLSLFENINA